MAVKNWGNMGQNGAYPMAGVYSHDLLQYHTWPGGGVNPRVTQIVMFT